MRTTWSTYSRCTAPIKKADLTITFVRHGRTEWNTGKRFQGHTDVPLSEEGREETRAVERALAGEHFDLAVASDLQRAHDTARTIVGERTAVTLDARWREFDFGAWEGLTWDEITGRWPQYAEQNSFSAATYRPEGGESFDDVCARVAAALDDLRAGPHGNVLVATHAGPLHAMLHVLFSGSNEEAPEVFGVRFMPASITRVAFINGRAHLMSLNDVKHLDPSG